MRNGQSDLLLRGKEGASSGAGSGPDMRSQIRHGDIYIAPKLAEWVLNNCFYEGQRGRMKSGRIGIMRHVVRLRRGRWLNGSQITFCRLPGGSLVLVNGYHRLNAIIEFGEAAKFNLQIIDVGDHDEVDSTYSLFDRPKDSRARSKEQYANALHFHDVLGLSKTFASAVGAAVVLAQNGYKPIKTTDREKLVEFDAIEDVLELAKQWKDAAQLLDAAFKPATTALKRKLMVGAVLSVALTTARYQPEKAKIFWSNVARNDGLRKNTPEHTLVAWLMSYRMEARGMEGFVAAALAWNAYYRGQPVGMLRVGASAGVYIVGCHVDHRGQTT